MFTALVCTSCRQLFRITPAGFKRDQTGRLVRLCESCQVDHQSATTTATRITASDTLDGQTQELIRGLKYRNQRRAVSILARQLVKSVRDDPDALVFEIVTWAPTSSSRRRRRGYDQSELLARSRSSVGYSLSPTVVSRSQSAPDGANPRRASAWAIVSGPSIASSSQRVSH